MSSNITIDKITSFTHTTSSIPSLQSLDSLAHSLPHFLSNVWSQVGWSSWHDGAFWLCNPREFRNLSVKIFSAVSEPEDYICFGYDAIGHYLHFWHHHHGIVLIDTIVGDILMLGRGCCEGDDGSHAIAEHLLQTISLSTPWLDRGVTTIISALIGHYGPLSSGEIYAQDSISTEELNGYRGSIRRCAQDMFHLRADKLEFLVLPDIDTTGAPNCVQPVAVIAESCLARN